GGGPIPLSSFDLCVRADPRGDGHLHLLHAPADGGRPGHRSRHAHDGVRAHRHGHADSDAGAAGGGGGAPDEAARYLGDTGAAAGDRRAGLPRPGDRRFDRRAGRVRGDVSRGAARHHAARARNPVHRRDPGRALQGEGFHRYPRLPYRRRRRGADRGPAGAARGGAGGTGVLRSAAGAGVDGARPVVGACPASAGARCPPNVRRTDMTTRRQCLQATAAAASMMALGSHAVFAAEAARAGLITREIPGTSERLPVVGLGSSATFSRVARSEDVTALREVLARLVELGGTVFDTAPSYGASEEVAGRIAQELGIAQRLFWATKLNVASRAGGAADPAAARAQLETSFQRTGKPAITLVQVHNMRDLGTQLAILRAAKAEGQLRYIR